ncbi:MAG: hypothetical protein AAF958_19845, partial [Planctomycetota bacterium]
MPPTSRRQFNRELAAFSGLAMGTASHFAVNAQNPHAQNPDASSRPPTHTDTFELIAKGKRAPVIFDTDIGSDIDDTWALLY